MSNFKVWRRKLTDEFSAHLTICTCVQISVNHPKLDMAEIYAHVLQIYLARLKNQELHPRQAAWSDQMIIEAFTPFSSQAEWDLFNKAPQNSGQSLKKSTPADVGIDVKYVTWAKAIWAKYTRFRAHIINVVNVDFKALLRDGRIKSGMQTSNVVEMLRRKYFDEWSTTTNGVVTHTTRPIEECPDWSPGSWWHSWVALGPPQGGNAVAPFLDIQETPVPSVQHAADKQADATTGSTLPAAIAGLLTHQFTGRKEQRDNLQ